VGDSEQRAAGFCLPGRHPLPQIFRILTIEGGHRQDLVGHGLAVAIDHVAVQIVAAARGNPRKKNSGWQDRSFCTTREGLSQCVREYCGEVEDETLAQLQALPEFHSEWERLQ
jgi:hypothetical protein